MQWTNDQPIYQQVRDHVVSLIIDGILKSGDPIPSCLLYTSDAADE